MPGSFSLDDALSCCWFPLKDERFKYVCDRLDWWPWALLFSVDFAPLGPIPVPMLLGTWLQAGDVTDFTRLEPRPMPDIVAFLESELYAEMRGDKGVDV